jgi:hypothetical protein
MIENITTEVAGLVGVLPKIIYIETNNTIAEVIATGFLNKAVKQGYSFSEYDMALVSTKLTPSDSATQLAWFQIDISGSNTSLVSPSGPGSVTLPTITNHIATYTNTAGALGEDAATAINGGNIQAGLSGTAGYLASFPATAARGSLRLTAVANTGDTLVTISNAAHGQASVYSIPDGGGATANFIISRLTGTQHITVGAFQVDAGIISSGISTGGTAGGLWLYPATTTTGSLRIVPVGNVGNFATTISDIAGLGQAQVITIPDSGAATANFILSGSGGTQHITTGAFQVDAGVISSGISTGGTAGGFIAYPATASNGSLRLVPVGNAGDFAVSISDIATQGQATVMTIPDVAAATGEFVVKTAAFVSGNLIEASGTAGLTVDSGVATTALQLKAQVVAQQSADIGGSGAGPIDIAVVGATTASVAVASVLSSSNAASILTVVPGVDKISVTFTADPGAAAVINYVVYYAAQ